MKFTSLFLSPLVVVRDDGRGYQHQEGGKKMESKGKITLISERVFNGSMCCMFK